MNGGRGPSIVDCEKYIFFFSVIEERFLGYFDGTASQVPFPSKMDPSYGSLLFDDTQNPPLGSFRPKQSIRA